MPKQIPAKPLAAGKVAMVLQCTSRLHAGTKALFNFPITSVDKYHHAADSGRDWIPSITMDTAGPFQGFDRDLYYWFMATEAR